MIGKLGRGLVRPAGLLMGPFRLVWKVLIAVILLALPLGLILNAYVGDKSTQVATAAGEEQGAQFVGAADQLLSQLVVAWDAVMSGRQVPSGLSTAFSTVDAVNSQVGTPLGVNGQWNTVRSEVVAAESGGSADSAQVYSRWNIAVSGVQSLVTDVAEASKLPLDPGADTYYLQDALAVQIPDYLVDVGRAGNPGTAQFDPLLDPGTTRAEATQVLLNAQVDMDRAIDAAPNGAFAHLSPLVQTLLASSKDGLTAVVQNVQNLSGPAATALVRRLGDQVSDLRGDQLGNELIAIVLGVLALWLFAGILVQAAESTSKLVKAMEVVASGDVTVEADLVGQDEFGQVAQHLNAALGKIRSSLQIISEKTEKVVTSSRDLFSISAKMSGTAESVSDKAAAVSVASGQVNSNVTVVAAAIEEMVASVKEIASNASKASEVATRASGIATLAGANIGRLEESSVEISNVVSLITSIAEQTNLLALNATIEAARAGEMGKGFAVVANEVKDLASKTTKATEDISHRIEAIQANTQSATDSVTQIRQIVEEINDIQGSIATSVEEQAAAVSEVGRSVAEAAISTSTIVDNIGGVAVSAQGNREMAEKNLGSAEGLSSVSGELQTMIGSMLGQFHFENGAHAGNGSDPGKD